MKTLLFILFMCMSAFGASRPELHYGIAGSPIFSSRGPAAIYSTNSATVTWAFTGGMDLLDAGNNAGTTVVYTNDNGALMFTNYIEGTVGKEYARTNATGQTWITWGVPSGAFVFSNRLSALTWKLPAVNRLSTLTNAVRVIDSAGASVFSADLFSSNMPIVVGTGWSNVLGGQPLRQVTAAKQAAATDVRVEVECTIKTVNGSGTSDVRFEIDTFSIVMYYYTISY